MLLLLGIVSLVFRSWFINAEIIGGDWPYFYEETLKDFPLFPPVVSPFHGNGLGGVSSSFFIDQYLYFTIYIANLTNIPWATIYKIFWFWFFIFLSILSIYYLLKTVIKEIALWQIMIGGLIFTANTYILMVVAGGQMGIALAYSIAPLVVASFIKILQNLKPQLKNLLIAGLILGLQIMFDPRIAYITLVGIVLYILLLIIIQKSKSLYISFNLLIAIGVSILFNLFWIIPLLSTGSIPVSEGLLSPAGLRFLSFADFSHSLSLLHPNWPENIFGKTYFLDSKFLILPIIAFSSLLFIKNNRHVLFFSLLALVGAFLAKGSNAPFGEINQWLFQYVPGMNMFRDPTKFYLLIALSYSVLIPHSTGVIFNLIKSQSKFKISNFKLQIKSDNKIFNFQNLFLIVIALYLLLLIRPALFGQLGGTFAKRDVLQEYVELKEFLHNQSKFFRTLWIPRQNRFSYFSYNHPSVEAIPLFKATNSAQIIYKLEDEKTRELLSKLAIKYIIVPYDPHGEIFIKDRKYNEKEYLEVIRKLEKISWIKRIEDFKEIAVFEVNISINNFKENNRKK